MSSPSKRENKVFVDKVDVLESLMDASTVSSSAKRTNKHFNKSIASQESETHSRLLKEQRQFQNEQTEIILQQTIKKALERQTEKQEKRFPVLLNNLHKAQSFLDVVDKELSLFDETKKNKVRRQYEEWNTNVHGAIQQNIAKTVNAMDSKTINRRKNEDYEQFLNITNRKPAIFRDIIIESEYDPLEPNRRAIVAKTGRLKDPVNIDAQKAEEESGMLGTKKAKPVLCKDTLNVELWASGKIEGTPYGAFAKMMGSPSEKPMSDTQKSHVVFDHYTFPKGSAAIEAEMPRGKRIHFQTTYSNPGKVFNKLPASVEKEIASIKPPEGEWRIEM